MSQPSTHSGTFLAQNRKQYGKMFIEPGVSSQAWQNQPSGVIHGVKERFKRYWRHDNGRSTFQTTDRGLGASSHRKVPSNDSTTSQGWLRYLTGRTLWTSRTSPVDVATGKELSRRILKTRVKQVIRTKSMESVLPASNGEVSQRSMGIRRSLSVPSDEVGKIQAALKRSVSVRQNVRGGHIRSFHTLEERTVEQTKDFCRDYIVFKLRRNSLLNRVKVCRAPACDQWLMQDIYVICSELERRNPSLCKNLSKQIGITLRSEEVLKKVFFEFAVEIVTTDSTPRECHRGQSGAGSTSPAETKSAEKANKSNKTLEVTWGRIMAIIAIAGALAIDCVKQGHSELVNELIEYCGEFFLGEGVVDWIVHQGGWETLSEFNTCKTRDTDAATTWNIILITACVAASLVLGVGISNLTAVGV